MALLQYDDYIKRLLREIRKSEFKFPSPYFMPFHFILFFSRCYYFSIVCFSIWLLSLLAYRNYITLYIYSFYNIITKKKKLNRVYKIKLLNTIFSSLSFSLLWKKTKSTLVCLFINSFLGFSLYSWVK